MQITLSPSELAAHSHESPQREMLLKLVSELDPENVKQALIWAIKGYDPDTWRALVYNLFDEYQHSWRGQTLVG